MRVFRIIFFRVRKIQQSDTQTAFCANRAGTSRLSCCALYIHSRLYVRPFYIHTRMYALYIHACMYTCCSAARPRPTRNRAAGITETEPNMSRAEHFQGTANFVLHEPGRTLPLLLLQPALRKASRIFPRLALPFHTRAEPNIRQPQMCEEPTGRSGLFMESGIYSRINSCA